MCLAWWGEGSKSKSVRRGQAPNVPLCRWHHLFYWRLDRCDVRFCGRLGGEGEGTHHSSEKIFPYAASARSTVLTPARCPRPHGSLKGIGVQLRRRDLQLGIMVVTSISLPIARLVAEGDIESKRRTPGRKGYFRGFSFPLIDSFAAKEG